MTQTIEEARSDYNKVVALVETVPGAAGVALKSVLDLHTPYEGVGGWAYCEYCADSVGGYSEPLEAPCDTFQALTFRAISKAFGLAEDC